MKSEKALIYIIIIIGCFFGIALVASTLNAVLSGMGINAKPVVVFVAFAVIVSIVKRLNRDLKNSQGGARKDMQEKLEELQNAQDVNKARHIDFMTNRATTPVCENPALTEAGPVPAVNEDNVNGVVWRWRPGRRGPEIIGAFCSKCAQELVAVKTSVSWEADLRCGGCGRTFISVVHADPNVKPHSFGQTKKLVAQIINDRRGYKP